MNDMLNHTDPSLKITELYIRKDYKAINAANKQVLDMVLGKKGSDLISIKLTKIPRYPHGQQGQI